MNKKMIDRALRELAEIVRGEMWDKGGTKIITDRQIDFDKACDHIADKIEKGE